MPAPRKYPQEVRERAVRMVFEVREQTGNAPGAIARVAQQLGVHREALRGWVRQAEVDGGQRPGTSTADAQRIAELEREVRELRRANEILKSAALDSNDQRNTASGWVDRGSDGSAGDVGRDERGLVAAVARG
ncbi:transposase [Nonomuraea sp. KM90]|uniref:transposase n=1 Tax=Nonomuraea sp. KM90 TaxID=3457428 RepID=UPI003FCC5A3B